MRNTRREPRPNAGEVIPFLETFKPINELLGASQMADRKMVAITGDFIKFQEVGQKVEGTYQGYSMVEMNSRAVPKYSLLKEDGAQGSFLGTVRLVEALSRVPSGAYVSIEYTGKSEASQSIKEFNVLVEEGTQLQQPKPLGNVPAYSGVDVDTGEIYGA